MQYPTLEEIRKDYYEVCDMIFKCKSFDDFVGLVTYCDYDIEINGKSIKFDDVPNDMPMEDIDMVRVDSYGNLDYIYFHNFGNPHKKTIIYFDVWCEDLADDFLYDTTIDTLDRDYKVVLDYFQREKYSNVSADKIEKMVDWLWDYMELCNDIANANINVRDYMFMNGRKIIANRIQNFLNMNF